MIKVFLIKLPIIRVLLVISTQLFPSTSAITSHISLIRAQDTISETQTTNLKGEIKMSNSNNSGSNKAMVPEARAAMDKFKMEAASEVGVNLKEGYNGDLTSRQAGSIGGQMVKKMIESYEQQLANQG